MTSPLHSQQTTTDGIHTPVAFIYANQSARLAASGFVSTDLNKVALQQSDNTLWLLTDTAAPTWAKVGGGASGITIGDSISSGTNSRILFQDTNAQLAQSSNLGFNGNYLVLGKGLVFDGSGSDMLITAVGNLSNSNIRLIGGQGGSMGPGNVTIAGGDTWAGNAGAVNIAGGHNYTGDFDGGAVTIAGGEGPHGGGVYIIGGSSGSYATYGAIEIGRSYTSAINIGQGGGTPTTTTVYGIFNAPYAPTNSGDWDGDPTTIKAALDRLAAAYKALTGDPVPQLP